MKLTHDAMLVSLKVSNWSGRRHDRDVSDEVAGIKGASRDAGRYNKQLLPKVAFAKLTKIASKARTEHYANTLPWDDKGSRLLTTANYETYTGIMTRLAEDMVRERTRFIEDWELNLEGARLELGAMFRLEDYPAKDHLPGKFSIRYRILPVPDVDHFLARLNQGETDRVKADMERHISDQLNVAVADLYQRLGDAVGHVAEKLDEDDEGKALVFRNSLVDNVRELVDVVPRLNIFGDDKLACLCEQVKAKIARFDADQLRPHHERFDPQARKQVKRDAAELREAFAGYFGGAS